MRETVETILKPLYRGKIPESVAERVERAFNLYNALGAKAGRLPYIDEEALIALFSVFETAPRSLDHYPDAKPLYEYMSRKGAVAVAALSSILGVDIDVKPATAALIAALYSIPQDYINKIEQIGRSILLHARWGRGQQPEPLSRFNWDPESPGEIIFSIVSGIPVPKLKALRDIYRKLRGLFKSEVRLLETIVPAGVPEELRPIQSLEELPRLAPEEAALLSYSAADAAIGDYAVYRVLSGQAMVYKPKGIVKPVIYIDRSGSTSQSVGEHRGAVLTVLDVEKAVAAAVAAASRIPVENIIFFDTTLKPASRILATLPDDVKKLAKQDIVYLLAPMKPSGGTSIDNVLIDITKRRDRGPFLIFTDAEAYVDLNLARKAFRKPVYVVYINSPSFKDYRDEPSYCRAEINAVLQNNEANQKMDGSVDFLCFLTILYPNRVIKVDTSNLKKLLRGFRDLVKRGLRSAALQAA